MCPDGVAAICTAGSRTGRCGPDSNILEAGICTTGAEGNAMVDLKPTRFSFIPEGANLSDLDNARANNLDVLDAANPNLKNEANDLQAANTAEITGNTVAEELAAVKAFDDDTWTEFTDPDQKAAYVQGDTDHLYDDKGNLKVNGGWGGWGAPTACSTHCGCGIRYRYRSCNNPAPQYGGLDCTGSNAASDSCNCAVTCPTPRPTPVPPTPVPPTPAPTPNPCVSGTHACCKHAGCECVEDATWGHLGGYHCQCKDGYLEDALSATHQCNIVTAYPTHAPTMNPTAAPTKFPTKSPTPAPTPLQCTNNVNYPTTDSSCQCECHRETCYRTYKPQFADTRRRRRRKPTNYGPAAGYYCHDHVVHFSDSRRRGIFQGRRRAPKKRGSAP